MGILDKRNISIERERNETEYKLLYASDSRKGQIILMFELIRIPLLFKIFNMRTKENKNLKKR
jgi:hypothetical protein